MMNGVLGNALLIVLSVCFYLANLVHLLIVLVF